MKKLIIFLCAFLLVGCCIQQPKREMVLEYKIHFQDESVTKFYYFVGNENARARIECQRYGKNWISLSPTGDVYSLESIGTSQAPLEIVAIYPREQQEDMP